MAVSTLVSIFFFFNDTATTEIYTLSLHDALPISPSLMERALAHCMDQGQLRRHAERLRQHLAQARSEEHTSELQSRLHLVCRLLLEKKKTCSGFSTFVPAGSRRCKANLPLSPGGR